MKSTVLSIAMIFIGILSISCVQKQQSSFIRTSATESIDVPVDYAIIEIGISNTQKDAVMLDNQSHKTLTQLLCIFKTYGIKEVYTEESKIETDYNDRNELKMSQSYKVKMHNLKEIDSFRKNLVKVGCNVFKIASYGSDSLKEYQEMLGTRCIDVAINKANLLTKTGKIQVGKISKILDERNIYDVDELGFEEIADLGLDEFTEFSCDQLAGVEKKEIEATIIKKTFAISQTMVVYFEIQK